jgi:hypothetical protein
MEQYPICRHIKTNGLQCHAPALVGGQWCYFHNRLHTRHSRFRPNDSNREYFNRGRDLELCALEDRESVQLAISVVINALATNAIETKRATALLYGLQLASINTARLNTAPDTPEVVRAVESSPEGLDLARPGAVIEVYTRLEPIKEPSPRPDREAPRSISIPTPELSFRPEHLSEPEASRTGRSGETRFSTANPSPEESAEAASSAEQPSNAAPSTAAP